MKWIFVLLVLGNAALFVWEAYYRAPVEPSTPVVAVGTSGSTRVNRLLKLSEIDSHELRERPPVDDSGERADAHTLADAAAPPNNEEAEPTADGSPIPGGESRPVCLSIGPLANDGDPTPLRDYVSQLGGVSELRIGERRELARYWVYFPPLENRASASARMEALRSKGIDDIYMIARGDMANAISLGVYSRKDSLRRRVLALNDAGYEPSVAPRYRTQKASWLDAKLPPGGSIPAAELAHRFQGLEVNGMICSDALKLPESPPSPTIPVPETIGPQFETREIL